MQPSPWMKPTVWAICVIGGNIAGNMINKEYFGPLEGTVVGAVIGSFATTYIDVMEMQRMVAQNQQGA